MLSYLPTGSVTPTPFAIGPELPAHTFTTHVMPFGGHLFPGLGPL